MAKTTKFLSVKIDGWISERTASKKEVEFAIEKLKTMNKGKYIRAATTVYQKYESGELFKDEIRKALLDILPGLLQKINIPTAKIVEETAVTKEIPNEIKIETNNTTDQNTEKNIDTTEKMNRLGLKNDKELEKMLEQLGVSSLDELEKILGAMGSV